MSEFYPWESRRPRGAAAAPEPVPVAPETVVEPEPEPEAAEVVEELDEAEEPAPTPIRWPKK